MFIIRQIEYLDINEIVPYINNPRNNEAAVDKVAASIKEFGFNVPLVIDKEKVIITGHTRYKAAKKLDLKSIPCIYAEGLTKAQVKAYRIADNKVSEYASWDHDLLGIELEQLQELDFDLELTGFDMDDIDNLLNIEEPEKETKEDEYEVELPKEPKAKLGDIYQLGNHRLMCGDSTNIDDVNKLMNGEKADMVFTDPPYGMKKEKNGVTNDNLNFDDLLKFNKQWIPLTFNVLKDNGNWYCWGIDEPLMDIYSNILKPMAKENKITFRNLITWDKGHGQGQLSEKFRMYPIADEKCLFVMCGVQGFNNNSDNYFEAFEPIRTYLDDEMKKCGGSKNWKAALGNEMGKHYFTKSQWEFPTKEAYSKLQTFGLKYAAFNKEYAAFKKEYDVIKKEYEKIKKEWYDTRAYFNNTHDNMNNVWHFDRAGKEERTEHATPKPIALCSRAVKSSSRENENVLDVFGGSGSTLMACEQLNRNCFTMELEPKWVDVIIDRWEQFTGEKAVLLNGELQHV